MIDIGFQRGSFYVGRHQKTEKSINIYASPFFGSSQNSSKYQLARYAQVRLLSMSCRWRVCRITLDILQVPTPAGP